MLLARLMLSVTTASMLIVSGLIGEASAQPASGSLVGRVVICRDAFAPVSDPTIGEGQFLQDVPSPGGGHLLASMAIPVPDLQVMVQGTTLNTRTDDNGRFSLIGVPTDQSLSLNVVQQPGGPSMKLIENVVINQGQTLDLGMLVLSGGTDQSSVSGPCSV